MPSTRNPSLGFAPIDLAALDDICGGVGLTMVGFDPQASASLNANPLASNELNVLGVNRLVSQTQGVIGFQENGDGLINADDFTYALGFSQDFASQFVGQIIESVRIDPVNPSLLQGTSVTGFSPPPPPPPPVAPPPTEPPPTVGSEFDFGATEDEGVGVQTAPPTDNGVGLDDPKPTFA